MYCNVCSKYRKFKKLKYHIFYKKKLGLSIAHSKCGHEYENIFKEDKLIEINLKFLV